MNNNQLQEATINLVRAKAALDEAEIIRAVKAQEVEALTQKISKENQYSKDPDAFINCGDLGFYHLKFHKENGSLVAIHLIKTAVLESPK